MVEDSSKNNSESRVTEGIIPDWMIENANTNNPFISTKNIDPLLEEENSYSLIRERIQEYGYTNLFSPPLLSKNPSIKELSLDKSAFHKDIQLDSFSKLMNRQYPLSKKEVNGFYCSESSNKLNFIGIDNNLNQDTDIVRIYLNPYTSMATNVTAILLNKLKENGIINRITLALNKESYQSNNSHEGINEIADNTIIFYLNKNNTDDVSEILNILNNVVKEDKQKSFPDDFSTLQHLYSSAINSFSIPILSGICRVVEVNGLRSWDTNTAKDLSAILGISAFSENGLVSVLDRSKLILERLKLFANKNLNDNTFAVIATTEGVITSFRNENIKRRNINTPPLLERKEVNT